MNTWVHVLKMLLVGEVVETGPVCETGMQYV